jgi:NAD(P)-dependent dehydrogenase (short-subunit alcohol dehydrogenase family)
MELAGKVTIVTGSGGPGSGRAVARRMAREGASVVVNDIDERGGWETVELILKEGGRASFLSADVGVESEARGLVAFAENTYGGLDVLVNNASAPYRPADPLGHWLEAVQVDLLGAMYTTLAGISAMQRRGGGAIVNIGSTSAMGHGRKHSGSPAYDVAKAGVTRLTTTLGWLADRYKIRVNCLVSDWVATPEVKSYFDALTPEERREKGVPPVLTTLDEIADTIVQLATDETLAGRVVVWWSGEPRRLIPLGDPGYARLDPG